MALFVCLPHKFSTNGKTSEGKGVIILFRVFLFSNWYFYGTKSGKVTTLHEIFAGVGSGMFTLETNRPLDMDESCLAGKVIIAIHSRVPFIISKLLSI